MCLRSRSDVGRAKNATQINLSTSVLLVFMINAQNKHHSLTPTKTIKNHKAKLSRRETVSGPGSLMETGEGDGIKY